MAIYTSCYHARTHLAEFWDRVVENGEAIAIRRRGSEAVALIAEHEMSGLLETAHLLRSRRNAERLLRALNRACRSSESSSSVKGPRREFGLE